MDQPEFDLSFELDPESASGVKDMDELVDDSFSRSTFEMQKAIIRKGRAFDDYLAAQYGVCPECGHAHGRLNIGNQEYSFCFEHRLKWVSGPNHCLFKWAEAEDEFYANWLYLADFVEVQPARSKLSFREANYFDEERLENRVMNGRMREAETISHFGACPVCLKLGDWRNIFKADYAYCPRHKTKWLFGINNISDWRKETFEQSYANFLYLLNYREVNGIGIGMPVKEIERLLVGSQAF